MYTYTPTQKDPDFLKYSVIRKNDNLTLDDYEAWKATLPDSPVSPVVRMVVRGAYQVMDSRLVAGNRLYAQYRTKLGLAPSEKADAEKEAAKLLKRLKEEYELVTEGCAKELPSFRAFKPKPEGLITEYAELVLIDSFFKMQRDEESQFSKLKVILQGIPLYDHFLEHVGGVGPKLSGFLLSELNPYRAPNASSVWRYMGLDVHESGRGRGTAMAMMEPRWTRVRKGEGYELKRVTNRTYDARKKAKVVKIGMECIIKASMRWNDVDEETFNNHPAHLRRNKGGDLQIASTECPYCLAYLGYRHRLTHSDQIITGLEEPKAWKNTSELHRHTAARRYMAKIFLRDMWLAWRMLEGLPVTESYEVAYLGKRPHHEPAVHLMPVLKYLEQKGTVKFNTSEPRPAAAYSGDLDFDEDLDVDPLA